jgi:ABC-type transport system substrate-binding protein
MKRVWVLILLALGLLIGCQQEAAKLPKPAQSEVKMGGVYRAALPWLPRSLDPPFTTDVYSAVVIKQLFDGLVQFDEYLNVTPALATSWRVSDDGTVYTFNLREDVTFHNGRRVTADDFVYSFSRIMDSAEDSEAFSFVQRIKGAEAYRRGESSKVTGLKASSPQVFEIVLEEAFSPFLSGLAMKSFNVVPREEIERWGEEFTYHPVGTGPFRLEAWESEKIILRANPDYYAGPPYLDRVEYTIYAGSQNEKIYSDFMSGSLEEAAVFGANREKMSQSTEYQFFRKPTLSLLFYGMNCTSPPLRDKKVRQALNYSINKVEVIHQYLKGQFIPAATILPPGMPAYTPNNKAYMYDENKGRALLEEAGYGPRQNKLSLTIVSASKSKLAQEELALVASDLAAVGVDLEIQYQTHWPSFEALLKAGKFQLYRYAWFADVPDPDNFLNALCGSESGYNFMGYRNPEVDRLLSQALRETDMLNRVTFYRQAERLILDDAPMIPWLYMTFEAVFQPYVKGLQISALGRPYIPLKKIWLDKE